ncbi:lipase family alpha/beta hydrolase [Spongisporangium articulatum]|uniref:Lipase family alpha/beta hydrolase n=1 Tax=Spongisporangium articulatum TaxID=3362603 RepID=A0ABW8APF3_9ACTN
MARNGQTGALARVPAKAGRTTSPSARNTYRGIAVRLGRDLRALATPRGLRGAATESVWLAAHLAMYPMGILRERGSHVERYNFEGLTPRQRSLMINNTDAATTPILLVHGMLDNRAIFALLIRRLRAFGFTRVVTLNYSPITNDIRAAAEGLAAAVEELVGETGYERIHIVGHSLGGLIARYYVQRLGGDERVHTLVTLGTPHHGSLAAHVIPANLGRQLRPGSDLFEELDEPARGCRTRFLAFWSDIDQLVVPHDNARLNHRDLTVRNELVHGVGHLSLPINGDVVQRVSQALSELNTDGTTLSAGVTSLHAS